MLQAPTAIDKNVRRILSRLSLSPDNVHFLDVKAAPGAIPLECFENVRVHAQQHGGTAVHGWLIWLWPNVLIEAEFHCVWRSSAGHLAEVTPRPDGDGRVLFVADPRRVYDGCSVDNIRIALRDDKVIRDFIRSFELKFAGMNRGDRAKQHGYVSVPADEIEPLLELGMLTENMIRQGLRDHDPCICGSGRKYKKCHGSLL